jgi:DNA-binding beta-propeller fold protein YncE
VGTFPIGSQPRNIIITPDGNTVYETNFDSKDYYAIDAHTLQLKYVKSLGAPDGIGLWGTPFSSTHGYVYKAPTGKSVSFDLPEAVATWNYGISDCGRISGSYQLNNVMHGFVAVPEECK